VLCRTSVIGAIEPTSRAATLAVSESTWWC